MNYKCYLKILILISFIYAENTKRDSILFVGNSFTFYFNLPLVVESMAKEKGINLNIFQSTAGGATLKHHWEGKKKLFTRSLIEKGSFSKIVLQDYSTHPVNKPVESMEYFNRFITLAKSRKAKIYLYGTWPVPAMAGKIYTGIDPIQHALEPLLGKEVKLVPVGTAFRLFKKKYPNIPLYTSDNKHPSPVGVYLAACVFLKAITGESPIDLYRRYDRKDDTGKKVFLGMVEKKDAMRCQNIVEKMKIVSPISK